MSNYEYTPVKKKNNYILHISLFLITLVTTTFSGLEWRGILGPYPIRILAQGLPYSLAILFILSCHEFGHYFAAKYHKVDATLPYFIPFPPLAGFLNFGTMGAVIKTRSVISNRKTMFDIGVAGPLAGFVACIIVLLYGFTHLPDISYLKAIHPDYGTPSYGKNAIDLIFGDTLLFSFFKYIFAGAGFIPPMSEIYHYPYLCVGWFGLFVTAMNMIPIGQLDGGHIAYTMFGTKKHHVIASVSFTILLVIGMLGLLQSYYTLPIPQIGWAGWLLWAVILFFFIKLKHPEIEDNESIGTGRMILGYISFAILILSFTPNPFVITG